MSVKFEDALSEKESAFNTVPRSALAFLRRDPSRPPCPGVRLDDGGLQGVVLVRADLADPQVSKRAATALGVALKVKTELSLPQPGRVLADEAGLLLRLKEDELLVLTRYGAAPKLAAALKTALTSDVGAAVLCEDISDGYGSIRLQGGFVREALAGLSSLDAHPKAFSRGDVRRSRIGSVETTMYIDPRATEEECAPAIHLLVARSYAPALFELLSQARPEAAIFGPKR